MPLEMACLDRILKVTTVREERKAIVCLSMNNKSGAGESSVCAFFISPGVFFLSTFFQRLFRFDVGPFLAFASYNDRFPLHKRKYAKYENVKGKFCEYFHPEKSSKRVCYHSRFTLCYPFSHGSSQFNLFAFIFHSIARHDTFYYMEKIFI